MKKILKKSSAADCLLHVHLALVMLPGIRSIPEI